MRRPTRDLPSKRSLHDWRPRSLPVRVVRRMVLLCQAALVAAFNMGSPPADNV